MDLGLAGKRVFVTGASKGIGATTARLFAQEGADVAVGYHHEAAGAQEVVAEITALGRCSLAVQFDVTEPGQVAAAAAEVKAVFGSLDCLVLNAGRNRIEALADIAPSSWDEIVATNLSSPFYVLQAFLPLLADGAAVVAVSSVAAHTGAPHHAHYAAAKAGLIGLTKSAARALAPRCRVNCVAPGITETEMGQATVQSLPPNYAARSLPLGRFAQPEEIAQAIVFLASPAASFITGETLNVNGGRDMA